MNKFKELLFLSNIKRVGKGTINDKYLELVKNSENFNDLISNKVITSKYSKERIVDAIAKTEPIYEEVINNSEINVITVFDEE